MFCVSRREFLISSLHDGLNFVCVHTCVSVHVGVRVSTEVVRTIFRSLIRKVEQENCLKYMGGKPWGDSGKCVFSHIPTMSF